MLKIILVLFSCVFLLAECQKVCRNGGMRVNTLGVDYCVCHKNYFGDTCETDLNELTQAQKDRLGCALKPCWFGSTCEDLTHLNGTFKCHCSANTFGTYCEKSSFDTSDPCITNPCYNGGVCEPLDAVSYKCNCNSSFGGISCKQSMLGGCILGSTRCQKESICVPQGSNDYKCNCLDWTIGKNCEVNFNPCQITPCANQGVCSKRRTLAFECQCPSEFTGLRCDQKVEESCIKSGCGKRGKCVVNETNGQYNCKCDDGFSGNNCELEQCNPKCKRGVCKRLNTGAYRCECPSSYKGADCSQLACFPEDQLVDTQEYGQISISKLKTGDHVKTYDSNSRSWKYTKVITYLHKDENIISEYYILETSQNRTLKLSADHLIAKFEQQNRPEYIYAKDVKIGDLLLDQERNDLVRVTNIELEPEKGAYAPLTEDGTLYVNNILVSCYANIQSHRVAHAAMQPLILASKMFGQLFSFDMNQNSNTFNGHSYWYSDLLYNLVTSLPAQLSNFIFTVKL